MNKRPIAITIIAVLLILAGAAGLVGDFMHLKSLSANHYETVWIAGVHVLALVAGAFMLRGRNWARWLAVFWMAFHVIISIGHPLEQLIVHVLFLLLFVYSLFRADARTYFAHREAEA